MNLQNEIESIIDDIDSEAEVLFSIIEDDPDYQKDGIQDFIDTLESNVKKLEEIKKTL